uniref:Uncharacterized protein n=1 Tax=Oryza meridionalis TaxID=40149 RepID=A0A0E0EQI4_9ORYZ
MTPPTRSAPHSQPASSLCASSPRDGPPPDQRPRLLAPPQHRTSDDAPPHHQTSAEALPHCCPRPGAGPATSDRHHSASAARRDAAATHPATSVAAANTQVSSSLIEIESTHIHHQPPAGRRAPASRMGRPLCCDKVGVKRGAMDAGGGPDASLLHPGARRRQLARCADQHRADALQQELPALVDELPPAGDQVGELHRAGREAHRPPPGSPRQPEGSYGGELLYLFDADLSNFVLKVHAQNAGHTCGKTCQKNKSIYDMRGTGVTRQRLLINPEEHPMLIVEPSTNTGQQREKYLLTLKIMKA